MNPREAWLTKRSYGQTILNLGFIGKGEDGIELQGRIHRANPGSLIVGADINEKLLKMFIEPNSVIADACHLPFRNQSFDVVIAGELLEHFWQVEDLIKEVSRVMMKNGRFIITTPSSYAIFRLIKHWMFNNVTKSEVARGFLGDKDHKTIWEPFSLLNLLAKHHLQVTEMTTKDLGIPYLGKLRHIDIPFWPFNRLGEYLCIAAKKI